MKLKAQCKLQFYLNSEMLVMSCSVGVAIYPNDGETTENMLQSADTAMYHAKSETGFSYQLFQFIYERYQQSDDYKLRA